MSDCHDIQHPAHGEFHKPSHGWRWWVVAPCYWALLGASTLFFPSHVLLYHDGSPCTPPGRLLGEFWLLLHAIICMLAIPWLAVSVVQYREDRAAWTAQASSNATQWKAITAPLASFLFRSLILLLSGLPVTLTILLWYSGQPVGHDTMQPGTPGYLMGIIQMLFLQYFPDNASPVSLGEIFGGYGLAVLSLCWSSAVAVFIASRCRYRWSTLAWAIVVVLLIFLPFEEHSPIDLTVYLSYPVIAGTLNPLAFLFYFTCGVCGEYAAGSPVASVPPGVMLLLPVLTTLVLYRLSMRRIRGQHTAGTSRLPHATHSISRRT